MPPKRFGKSADHGLPHHLHGRRRQANRAQFLRDRRDFHLTDAARHHVGESRQVIVHIERHAVPRDPVTRVDANRCQFPSLAPHARKTRRTFAGEAKQVQRTDYRCLDLPEGFQPAKGETVDQFLDRATKEAVSRDDLTTCRRIQSVRQSIAQSNGVSVRDVDNLRDYEAGRKQLAAGQFMLAVVSLQNALKSGSDLIPAAKVGEMLESIRKEHPKEFEQGMVEFLTPRPAPEYDFTRMPYRNYMPYSSRFMEGDPRSQGGTTLVLPIPAKEVPAGEASAKPTPPADPKPSEKVKPAPNNPPE